MNTITLAAPVGTTGTIHTASSSVYQIIEGKVHVAFSDLGEMLRLGFTRIVDEVEAVADAVKADMENIAAEIIKPVEAAPEAIKAEVEGVAAKVEADAVKAVETEADKIETAAADAIKPVEAPVVVPPVEPVAPAPAAEPQPAA